VQAYGLHGLERWTGGGIELDGGAATWQPVIAEARSRALAAALPGVEVEDKQFSVTLHWRQASDPLVAGDSAALLSARLAAATGLIARPGKASVELVPPIGIDKGTVVRTVTRASGARRVAFLGDDTSDLLAFGAIDGMVAGGSRISQVSGLKIAVAGEDVPDELVELADVVLAGPETAMGLLVQLAERLEAGAG
jgi:trehalose 6-phosphate phosphatase